MKRIFIAAAICLSIIACNNESAGNVNDGTEMKGNGDSTSGGTIAPAMDSSTSIDQGTGTLHDSLGAMKPDSAIIDSSRMKK